MFTRIRRYLAERREIAARTVAALERQADALERQADALVHITNAVTAIADAPHQATTATCFTQMAATMVKLEAALEHPQTLHMRPA
jgi:hypothetical protein